MSADEIDVNMSDDEITNMGGDEDVMWIVVATDSRSGEMVSLGVFVTEPAANEFVEAQPVGWVYQIATIPVMPVAAPSRRLEQSRRLREVSGRIASYRNRRVDQLVYGPDGMLRSARVRVFRTPEAVKRAVDDEVEMDADEVMRLRLTSTAAAATLVTETPPSPEKCRRVICQLSHGHDGRHADASGEWFD